MLRGWRRAAEAHVAAADGDGGGGGIEPLRAAGAYGARAFTWAGVARILPTFLFS